MSEPESALPVNPIPPENPLAPSILKAALKAFRKRLKIMRLDKESGKIGGPLSSGKSSGIVAIMAPRQFSDEVWLELKRLGRLKEGGGGTYELTDEKE